MTRPRLYLAGPMTGLPAFNFPAFENATHALRHAGWSVLSPHTQDHPDVQAIAWESAAGDPAELAEAAKRGLIGAHPLRTALSNVEDVAACDGVALLPGWHKSSGARHEVETAHRFGIPVAPVELWLASVRAELEAQGWFQ